MFRKTNQIQYNFLMGSRGGGRVNRAKIVKPLFSPLKVFWGEVIFGPLNTPIKFVNIFFENCSIFWRFGLIFFEKLIKTQLTVFFWMSNVSEILTCAENWSIKSQIWNIYTLSWIFLQFSKCLYPNLRKKNC